MSTQSQIDYNRIAKAIEYIQSNFRLQPSLEEVAENIHLSLLIFRRSLQIGQEQVRKNFYSSSVLNMLKNLLKEEKASLFDTAYETGLSSTSRLHDLFVKIEGMSPAEYKTEEKKPQYSLQFFRKSFREFISSFYRKRNLLYGFLKTIKKKHSGN